MGTLQTQVQRQEHWTGSLEGLFPGLGSAFGLLCPLGQAPSLLFMPQSSFICQTGSFMSCPVSLLLRSSDVAAGNRNEQGAAGKRL